MFLSQKDKERLALFFAEAISARRQSIFNELGCRLASWIADSEERTRLVNFIPNLMESEKIESGLHADAYMFDDYVIKTNVFDPFYRDGQMSWLKWASRNQTNPLVPQIHYLMIDEETERFVVVMERLIPHAGFEDHSFRQEINEVLRDTFLSDGRFPLLRKTLNTIKFEATEAIGELNTDIAMMDSEEDAEMIQYLVTAMVDHERTVRYIDEIVAFGHRLNRTHRIHFRAIRNKFMASMTFGQVIDVHSYNWMLRRNGDPVFLDPIN